MLNLGSSKLHSLIEIYYRGLFILASFTTANSVKRQKRALKYKETPTIHLVDGDKPVSSLLTSGYWRQNNANRSSKKRVGYSVYYSL